MRHRYLIQHKLGSKIILSSDFYSNNMLSNWQFNSANCYIAVGLEAANKGLFVKPGNIN